MYTVTMILKMNTLHLLRTSTILWLFVQEQHLDTTYTVYHLIIIIHVCVSEQFCDIVLTACLLIYFKLESLTIWIHFDE